jgi:ribosomal protein S18 acetylase RimI-like enzyme
MGNSIISKSTLNDLQEYRKISIDTFIEAYADRNTAADMDHYVNTYFTNEMIIEELRDPSRFIFFTREQNEITGYIKLAIKPVPLTIPIKEAMEISRIYIYKNYYGSGLANTLLNKAIEFAKAHAKNGLYLAVWKNNERAIAFYKKCGFHICGETTFDWGTGKIDQDWWMVKSI